jgi:hypothetical protein
MESTSSFTLCTVVALHVPCKQPYTQARRPDLLPMRPVLAPSDRADKRRGGAAAADAAGGSSCPDVRCRQSLWSLSNYLHLEARPTSPPLPLCDFGHLSFSYSNPTPCALCTTTHVRLQPGILIALRLASAAVELNPSPRPWRSEV